MLKLTLEITDWSKSGGEGRRPAPGVIIILWLAVKERARAPQIVPHMCYDCEAERRSSAGCDKGAALSLTWPYMDGAREPRLLSVSRAEFSRSLLRVAG